MTSFAVSPPAHDDDIQSLTDWAEATLLLDDDVEFVSVSSLRDRLGEARLDEESEYDAIVNLILAEVSRRSRIAPNTYPFARDTKRKGIQLQTGVDHWPYEFLLWLSISQAFREQKRWGETERPFNDLVARAMKEYLGNGSRVVQTAFGLAGEAANFRELVERVAHQMGLRYGGWQEPRRQRKDGGVDLIGWRPFADSRGSFIVLLCQCTVQKSWEVKATDIDPKLWTQWINFVQDPLTALAVPFAIPNDYDKWDEVVTRVHVIFDRFRICEMISAGNEVAADEYQLWCRSERRFLYL